MADQAESRRQVRFIDPAGKAVILSEAKNLRYGGETFRFTQGDDETTRRRRRSLFHREEGQAALEFLLVLPFFLVFLLLVVDFGLMMYEYVSVSNAVREGSRYGSVNCPGAVPAGCTPTLIQTRTIGRSGGILSNAAEVTVGWIDNLPTSPVGIRDRGDSVVVMVNHPYTFMFIPAFTIPAVSCADMSLEQRDLTTGLLTFVNPLSGGAGC